MTLLNPAVGLPNLQLGLACRNPVDLRVALVLVSKASKHLAQQ